jgi:flagellar M-ring protein FliF
VTAAVFVAPRLVAPPPGADGKAGEPQMQKRTPQEIDALRQVVINALGLRPAAGQPLESLVSLQEMSFQAAAHVPESFAAASGETRLQSWLELARTWAAAAMALGILVVFWRMLARQKPANVGVALRDWVAAGSTATASKN